MELIFCNLDAVGGPLGAEMELLVDLALTVEQQQSDGALQHQKTFEACAGPGRTGFLLGVWGAGYAYSCGLATISGGGLLTLPKAWNGGDLFAAYGGVLGLQMVCFLAAALMTRCLDVVGFLNTVKTRFADVMEIAVGEAWLELRIH